MILIVSLKKLSTADKQRIKKHYSLLEFNKFHLTKPLDKIGNAEVILFQLDISLFFNVKNNVMFKYLKSQNLTQFKVVWVYEKTKYKGLFDGKFNIRKLPLIIGKTLIEAVGERADYDAETSSVSTATSEEMAEFMIDSNIKERTTNDILEELKATNEMLFQLVRKYRDIADELKVHPKSPLPLPKNPPPKLKAKPFITDSGNQFKVFHNNRVIATFPYTSEKGKKRSKAKAQVKLNSIRT